MITVTPLTSLSVGYSEPDSRAALLGHAAVDYFKATVLANEFQWHDQGIALFNFLLPTMHQTVELVAKGIAYKAIPNFNPRIFSHQVLSLFRAHAGVVPSFATILQDNENVELLEALERSYLGVRYGECSLSYDDDAWARYISLTELLFADLSSKTGLRFPYGPTIGLLPSS